MGATALGTLGVARLGLPISEKKTLAEEETELSEALHLSGQKDTLYFWYTDEGMTDYLNSVAVSYNETKDDVRVVPVLKSGSEYLEHVNQASIDDEELPDIYLIGNDSLEKAYLAGLADQIQPAFATPVEELYPQAALDAVTYKDKLVGYPLSYVTTSFLYNETYLKDWIIARSAAEENAQAAEAEKAAADAETTATDAQQEKQQTETAKTDTSKTETAKTDTSAEKTADASNTDQANQTTEETSENQTAEETVEEKPEVSREEVEAILPHTMDALLSFADEYDAPEQVDGVFRWDVNDIFYNYFFVGDAILVGGVHGDDPTQIDLYNETAINSMLLYKNLNQFFSIDTEEVSYEGVVQDFIDGKIVFTVAKQDAIAKIEAAKAEGTFPYEYGVCLLPDISDTVEARTLSVTNAVVINAYSEHREAANEFAGYLVEQTKNGDAFLARTGKISALLDATYENPKYLAFMEEYKKSEPIAKLIETSNYWVKLEVAFSRIWNGENANAILKQLSEEIMTQVTGEDYEEEYLPVEEIVEEEETLEEPVTEDPGNTESD